MVISCSAYGCTARAKKGVNISFHKFPTDPSLRKKWLIATKRDGFATSKHAKLCSQHFQPDDFVYNFGRKSLAPGVIPTLFNFPKDLQKPTKQRSARLTAQESEETKTEPMIEQIFIVSELPCASTSSIVSVKEEVEPSFPEQPPAPSVQVAPIPEQPPVPAVQVAPSLTPSTKRKRSVPAYMGDVSPEDLENPQKFKRMWQIAMSTVERQKKTISYLRVKAYRLEKRVKALTEIKNRLQASNNNNNMQIKKVTKRPVRKYSKLILIQEQ